MRSYVFLSVQINIVIIIVFISTLYKQAASYIMYYKLYSVYALQLSLPK